MSFDISTAKPVSKGKFDVKTAKPVSETEEGMSFKERSFEAIKPTSKTLSKIPRRSFGKDIAGLIEGATFGIPRAGIEAVSDVNVPRGSQAGQLVGSILGAGKAFKLARAIPGLAKSTVRTGALTSGVLSQTPSITDVNAPMRERFEKGIVGTGIGGAFGALPHVASGIGRGVRQLSDVSKRSVERVRNLTGKYGKKFVFSESKVQPDFISREITPKVAKLEEEAIENLNPETLKQIGIKSDVIDDIKIVEKEFGMDKIPTTKEADEFFENVVSQADDSFRLQPEDFEKALKSSIFSLEKGLGKESPLVGRLKSFLNDLERKPSVKESILGSVGKIKVELDKDSYLGTRRALNSLFTGRPEMDRFIQPLKEALDKDASASGVTGIARARAIYRVSREVDKIRTYLNDPKRLEKMSTRLESAASAGKFQIRESIKKLLGEKSYKLLDELESVRLAREFDEKGFWPSRAGVIERGGKFVLSEFEKNRARIMDLIKRKRG